MSHGRRGRIYTFYSYKGGVGRSMALANVAALMVKAGQHVLVVDWDLEAPGLELFFDEPPEELLRRGIIPRDHNRKPLIGRTDQKKGVVDLLEAWADGEDLDWKSGLLTAEVFGRTLQILSAGQRTADYSERVSNLNWARLFSDADIGNHLNRLREDWLSEYDAVLVDSRTGVTDIGDICTVILPDVLVLMFVSNLQNINGIKYAMDRATLAHKKLPVDRARLVGVPIPARDEPLSEYEKSQQWKEIYVEEFREYYETWLPRGVTADEVLSKLFIPYVTNWSFGERLPVVERPQELDNPSGISAAYDRLTKLLMSGLDWESVINPARYSASQPDAVEERERSTYERESTPFRDDAPAVSEAPPKKRSAARKVLFTLPWLGLLVMGGIWIAPRARSFLEEIGVVRPSLIGPEGAPDTVAQGISPVIESTDSTGPVSAPVVPPAVQMGAYRIRVSPLSRMTLAGELVGDGRVFVDSLPPGIYDVSFAAAGFIRLDTLLVIAENETLVVTITLVPR